MDEKDFQNFVKAIDITAQLLNVKPLAGESKAAIFAKLSKKNISIDRIKKALNDIADRNEKINYANIKDKVFEQMRVDRFRNASNQVAEGSKCKCHGGFVIYEQVVNGLKYSFADACSRCREIKNIQMRDPVTFQRVFD
jgi:hypothetical protein